MWSTRRAKLLEHARSAIEGGEGPSREAFEASFDFLRSWPDTDKRDKVLFQCHVVADVWLSLIQTAPDLAPTVFGRVLDELAASSLGDCWKLGTIWRSTTLGFHEDQTAMVLGPDFPWAAYQGALEGVTPALLRWCDEMLEAGGAVAAPFSVRRERPTLTAPSVVETVLGVFLNLRREAPCVAALAAWLPERIRDHAGLWSGYGLVGVFEAAEDGPAVVGRLLHAHLRASDGPTEQPPWYKQETFFSNVATDMFEVGHPTEPWARANRDAILATVAAAYSTLTDPQKELFWDAFVLRPTKGKAAEVARLSRATNLDALAETSEYEGKNIEKVRRALG